MCFYFKIDYSSVVNENKLDWFGCGVCSSLLSEMMCQKYYSKCEWKEGNDDDDNIGVCIPSNMGSENITCELLSKPLCDKYFDESTYITGIVISNAPCFYNGPSDTSNTFCVSKTPITSCSNIQTNGIVLYNGKERESCNEANELLNSSLMCAWIVDNFGAVESCMNSLFLDTPGSFSYIMVWLIDL
jgi:hypothetical protein